MTQQEATRQDTAEPEIQRPLPTVIKDRFFDNPDMIRQWALKQAFRDVKAHNRAFGTSESWPGKRTQSLHELHPGFVQQFINHILSELLRLPPTDFKANVSFQLTTVDDGDSWVHMDDKLYSIGGLVYLTPDPPERSGTLFYRKKSDGEFQVTDIVANRYNRLLLFDSQVWHKSDRYFGTTVEDGRLTLPFFIDFRLKQG